MPDALEDYRLKQGDTFLARFRLRKRGQRVPWNVTGAVITLEWSREGVVGIPLVADPNHVQAAWGDGYVPILVGPDDITEIVGTVSAVLRVVLGGESVSLPHDGMVLFEIQTGIDP